MVKWEERKSMPQSNQAYKKGGGLWYIVVVDLYTLIQFD